MKARHRFAIDPQAVLAVLEQLRVFGAKGAIEPVSNYKLCSFGLGLRCQIASLLEEAYFFKGFERLFLPITLDGQAFGGFKA